MRNPRLAVGDIVVEISGGSPTQSTGRAVYVSQALLAAIEYPLTCSNFCRIFRPNEGYSLYTYFLLRTLYDAGAFLPFENGTTGIKNFAFTLFCEQHATLLPPSAHALAFERSVGPMIKMIGQYGEESGRLAALRDYLLPKLLSGAVRVHGGERQALKAIP